MLYRFLFNMLIGLLLIGPLNIYAQSSQDTASELNKILSEYIVESGPGGVLVINRGDQKVYQKSFGSSNLENFSLNNENTIFEAGSVSKQFTATAILLLIEEGKITIEDDVRSVIPELPQYKEPIRIRHLLNHTSGLKDWGSVSAISGWARGSKVYTNDLALEIIIKQPDLNNIPGEEYIYSNSNYTLLTIIVERVSGIKLPEFTQKYIFDKLNMNHTEWRTDFRKIVPNRATAYGKQGDFYLMQMPFENTYGHAALLTTVADLDKWNQSWKNSPLGMGGLLDLRLRRGVLNDGTTISYASGVQVKEHNELKEISHSGSTGGYKTWLAYYPQSELSVVFLSNEGTINPTNLGQKVANYFFGISNNDTASAQQAKKGDLMITQVKDKDYAGKYESDAIEGFLVVEVKSRHFIVRNAAGIERTFQQVNPGKFLQAKEGIEVHFNKNRSGKINGMIVNDPRARNIYFHKILMNN